MSAKSPPSSPANEPRRGFLWSLGAILVGALISLVSLLSGLVVFLDPLLGKRQPPKRFRTSGALGDGYLRVAALVAVPEDGSPQRFPIVASRADAWNYSPNQPIGAVYVRRVSAEELQVFQSTCPHAGCSISAVKTAEGSAFHCPCHNSSFDLTGKRVARPGKSNPAPRDMDGLSYKIVNGEVWVEFKEYFAGRPTKDAKS